MLYSNENVKTLGPAGAFLLTRLASAGSTIFTATDARRILGLSPHATSERLRLLNQRGWLVRLTRGTYMLVPLAAGPGATWSEDPAIIASHLARPSYLSFWSALHFHGLTEQVPGLVTVATRRPHPPIEVLGLRYVFTGLTARKFFGYRRTWVGSQRVPIASPEKAILDSLDHPKQAGGISEAAKALATLGPRLDSRRLLGNLRRMQHGAVAKRLGFLLETLGLATHLLPAIHTLVKAGYSLLDPTLQPHGRHLARWKLRINIPEDQLLAGIGT